MTYNACPLRRELNRLAATAAAYTRGAGSSGSRVHGPIAPPGVACAVNTAESGTMEESPPRGSPPPAAYTATVSPEPAGCEAAASATPAGAPGNAGRDCQVSVVGSKATWGRTWTVAVRCRPSALVTVNAPLVALSGTDARSRRSLHPPAGTGASTAPPPNRGKS